MNRLGLSSGSLPQASADEMVGRLHELGLDLVDLRWGKGYAWQDGGLRPFAVAGVDVAFLGVSVTLGEGDPQLADLVPAVIDVLDGRRDIAIKVFASAQLGSGDEAVWTVARRQLDRLATCAAAAPLVETHHGYAGLDSVDRLCQQLGCAVLLDLGGFFRLTGSFLDPAGVIARRTSAIQVKGFGPDAPATHRALTELPDEAWALLDSAPTGVPITVESKSGTLAEDIGVLRQHCAVAPVGLR